MPAINENIDLLGMGYLYQITDFTPEELVTGEVSNSDFNLPIKQIKNTGCMCKNIFFKEKKIKHLTDSSIQIDNELIFRILQDFNDASENFKKTAALHGSGLYSKKGEKIKFIEDIARTNTIYKMTGFLIANNITEQHIIVLSCRINTLILNLLSNIGFKVILTRASVTHETYVKAKNIGVTLVGFIKEDRFTVFSGVENINF